MAVKMTVTPLNYCVIKVLRQCQTIQDKTELTFNDNCCLTDVTRSVAKCTEIHRESKKGATLTMAITLSILDRFAKFFHCCKQQ